MFCAWLHVATCSSHVSLADCRSSTYIMFNRSCLTSAAKQERVTFTSVPSFAQIAGCGKDLWGAKSYYQRFRLCQDHLNLPSLVVNGVASRFCQKCLYFHPTEEFDGTKK
jgi:hypothetical protein